MWRRSLIGGALIVLIGNGLGLALGAGRDVILAARFGATEETDAYFLAFTVPNLVWQSMLVALMASFIPSYSAVEAESGRREADRFARGMLRLLGIAFIPLTALYALASPWLLGALGSGSPQSTIDRATELSYIMAPLVVVSVISSLLSSLLYAHDHYALPALGQGIVSGVLIVCILGLSSYGITSVAIGTLIGFMVKFGLEIVVLCRINPSYRQFWVGTIGPNVWRAVRLLILALVGFNLVGQGTQVLERSYASHLEPGAITALQYATKLGWVPLQFASAIAVALLPPLSRHAVSSDAVGSPHQLTTGVGLVTIVTIPAAFALLILADPITTLVYTRQAFGEAETSLTIQALQGYAWGLPAVAASLVLWNVLYARRDMTTPILISAVALMGYALLNSGFGLRESVFGVALANGLTSAITLIGIVVALRVKGGDAAVRPVVDRLAGVAKVAVICLALPVAIAWGIDRGVGDLDRGLTRLALVVVTIALYAAVIWQQRLDDGVVLRASRRLFGRVRTLRMGR